MTSIKKTIALILTLIMAVGILNITAQENIWSEDELSNYLSTLAEATKDPWQKAIYLAGAENLSMDEDTLSFYLRGYTPSLKTLPKYAEDAAGWYEGFFTNISEYSLEASLTFKDGEVTEKSQGKLKSTVKNAAAKAKETFGQQTVKTALLDMLFPIPYKDAAALKKGALNPSFEQWVNRMGIDEKNAKAYCALLYAQTGRQLNLKNGPHALEYSVKLIDPSSVLTNAEKTTYDELSKVSMANAIDSEELKTDYYDGLLTAATKLRKNENKQQVFTADIDQLAQDEMGDDYNNFLEAFTLEDSFDIFEASVRDLPDYPALDYPKNGRISGNNTGTKVVFKAPKDDYARYIQLRNASNNELIVDLFIRPGASATVRAPKGMAYLLYAKGTTWYGEEMMFGEESLMMKSGNVEIPSSKYIYTLTLEVSGGDTSLWNINKDEFKKK